MLINIIVTIFLIISIYYTIKYKGIQFRSLSKSKVTLKKNKTSYQAFMVSLASHIGTGNIVGITSALIIGGAGSLFWMWIFALFSSILSLMENTIGQIYKERINNEYRGGSAYYISKGLKKKWLGIIISFFLVLSNTIFFQPIQVNTISESLYIGFSIPKEIIFVILVLFTILVIFKGTKKIIKFSEFIVPIMSLGYLIVGLVVILVNIRLFPTMISRIISEAFNYKCIIGGCVYVGFKRSLFSHEAGLGTMPTISAMSDVTRPIEQGYISSLGVFIDTIVICSITGFMILLYDIDLKMYTGCDLIIYVFTVILGSFGKILAIFFMITFALATVVSQFYLGESNLLFITRKKSALLVFKLLFIIGIFLGVFMNTSNIWGIIDIGMIILGIINIYSLIKLEKEFRKQM